ncbi:MAG: ABC transporter permease [Methanomicrobiales archaeon]
MSFLLAVAVFGAAVTAFLWLRDYRIFNRTGLSGYRISASRGVLYTALSLSGVLLADLGYELVGLGVILLALYLQGRIEREGVWRDEGPVSRFFGAVERRPDKE